MAIKGFFGNWIVKNLLLAVFFVLFIVGAASIFLNLFTHHNKEIEVPEMTNLTPDEAAQLAAAENIRVYVIDSVFVRRMKPGVVFSQNPAAGSHVKKGRKIALTINANESKKVSMPSLVGYSMRQAKAELLSKGLTLGRLIYVNDMATNNVLQQIHNNREIAPGTQVESGSEVDLVLGLNVEDSRTVVPDVRGMKYLRAVDAVQENYLNISALNFDSGIKNYNDSVNAVVYSQRPAVAGEPVKMGSNVTLYLTNDPEKISKIGK
ncbi:MAG: PASTA domain-containing protein [Bacteroidales bacterium]|nr:PASTA domain-containing protein [Bacteroidales bacterium]